MKWQERFSEAQNEKRETSSEPDNRGGQCGAVIVETLNRADKIPYFTLLSFTGSVTTHDIVGRLVGAEKKSTAGSLILGTANIRVRFGPYSPVEENETGHLLRSWNRPSPGHIRVYIPSPLAREAGVFNRGSAAIHPRPP